MVLSYILPIIHRKICEESRGVCNELKGLPNEDDMKMFMILFHNLRKI